VARFFAQIQTGPGANTDSSIIGTGAFPGVKRPGRVADHPPLLAPKTKVCRAIPLPLPGLSSLLRGAFISVSASEQYLTSIASGHFFLLP
jgi:hypothetical protein